MIINFARRAHDHNWELDPITRSLLDTDFYKLLMLQFIWKHFPTTRATFTLINRSSAVPLGHIVNVDELREQLESTRKLRFHKSELIWLAGNTFYGRAGHLRAGLPGMAGAGFPSLGFRTLRSGRQFSLRFDGLWTETTLWEIYALSAIDELKTRASLKRLTELELDILYARAKTRLWEKMERLRGVPGLNVSDFGTRRRHSFLWQEYVVNAMSDVLGSQFHRQLEYIPRLQARSRSHRHQRARTAHGAGGAGRTATRSCRSAQYRLLELWQQTYQGELLILLPDTFGTTQFLRDAPGLGGRLDRAAHRQQGSFHCRRRVHRMA